jgi:hypothetical protein
MASRLVAVKNRQGQQLILDQSALEKNPWLHLPTEYMLDCREYLTCAKQLNNLV